jgi:alpha-tubulin suppressor-like RCC1 family protein
MNNRGELSQNFEKYNDYSFDGFTSDHSDSVYAWKDNYYYKFKEKKINKYKININIKKNSIIKKIACGKNFVIFLSDSGLVYSYGKNTKGQLGLEDYKERNTPTLNELLVKNGERIIDVSCGFKHTIALGINGKAYSWGSNSNGQCGIDIGGNFNTPMYIDVKNKIKFIGICCGFRASFFMDDQRILYFCGKSGINNGESYFINNFKNIIGEKETLNNLNNLINIQDKNHLEINYNDTYNRRKNKKSQRSLSTINLNRNKNVNIVSCLNKNIFPVKLNCSWNDSFSVMYITYADTTNLVKNAYKKELDKKKVKNILDKLTLNWINDNINVKNVMKDYKDILEYL